MKKRKCAIRGCLNPASPHINLCEPHHEIELEKIHAKLRKDPVLLKLMAERREMMRGGA